jgi:hypothetical protein
MRVHYYVVNERPLCAKCRPPYARKIERADGRGAMLRVGLQGGIVALVGAIVLAVAISMFSPLRLFLVIPIGYLIGKRMMQALDGYSARRYQYLAVGLTYLCFLVGFAVPAFIQDREARERHAANRARMENTLATQTDQLRAELGDAAPPAPAVADPAIGPGPGLAFVMFLLLPFIASLQFGLAFSAVGFSSIGYALYQAWTRTDGQGMQLQLRGPFRVGQGPIPAR